MSPPWRGLQSRSANCYAGAPTQASVPGPAVTTAGGVTVTRAKKATCESGGWEMVEVTTQRAVVASCLLLAFATAPPVTAAQDAEYMAVIETDASRNVLSAVPRLPAGPTGRGPAS